MRKLTELEFYSILLLICCSIIIYLKGFIYFGITIIIGLIFIFLYELIKKLIVKEDKFL